MRISDWSSDVCSSDLLGRRYLMCQMRDDDVAVLVALPARPRADLAVAGLVDLQQVMRFGNDFAAGRIIGCRHEFAELFDVRVRMLEQMQTDRKSTRLNSSH